MATDSPLFPKSGAFLQTTKCVIRVTDPVTGKVSWLHLPMNSRTRWFSDYYAEEMSEADAKRRYNYYTKKHPNLRFEIVQVTTVFQAQVIHPLSALEKLAKL